MSSPPLSLQVLRQEREQIHQDWVCFMEMYDRLKKRILESNEVQPPRNPLLHQWSGTHAVLGALELSIHAIERTRDEYDGLIRRIEQGEIPNADPPERPALKLVPL